MKPRAASFTELDELVHQKVRLGVLSALVHESPLTFTKLKDLLSLTDGNLSVHLGMLQKAKYVKFEKAQREGRVQTLVDITARGQKAFQVYRTALLHLLGARNGTS